MKKRAVLIVVGSLLLTSAVYAKVTDQPIVPTAPAAVVIAVEPRSINLNVPQIWEIPDGVWVKPWNGACEESSMTMVESFYLKTHTGTVPNAIAKKMMQPLFAIEDKLFGSNSDTNATRTAKVINDRMAFEATVKYNPTLNDIRHELQNGHPVISMHYGYDLNNPKHAFRQGGSSYHVMVINGYNDDKKVFYVNDPELRDGLDYPYSYDTILTTLHDFNHATHKADGKPVVLFTKPRLLAKIEGSGKIYFIDEGIKHHVTSPVVFTNRRWSWSSVKVISKDELASYTVGDSIDS